MATLFRVFYLLTIFTFIFVSVSFPGTSVSIHELFLFCALAIWFFEYWLQHGHDGWDIPLHPLWLAAFPIVLGGLISTVVAVSPLGSLTVTIKTAFVLTLWISLTMVAVQRIGLKPILWVVVIALAIESAITIEDRITGWDIGGTIAGRIFSWLNRSDGTLQYPDELAYFVAIALPLTLGLILEEFQNRRRIGALVVLAIVFGAGSVALFLSGAVSGLVSCLVSLGVILAIVLARADRRVRIGLGVMVVGLVVILLLYLNLSRQSTLASGFLQSNIGRVTDVTGPSRLGVIQEAIDTMAPNPFWGFGMDQSATGGISNSSRVTTVGIHNVIFAGWVGGGLLVLIGLLYAYAIAFATAVNALWRGIQRIDWLAIALGACTLGWIFFDETQPSLHHRSSWFTVGLLYGLGFGVRFLAGSVHRVPAPTAPALQPLAPEPNGLGNK